MKISVIIPCYNIEPYVKDCLDSLLRQTIGLSNLELILVDDASTDGTAALLQTYEARYPEQIMVILCPENGRQGTARNIGLQYATGDYVSFIDGDDWVHPDTYRVLSSIAQQTDADIVQFRYCFRPEDLPKEEQIAELPINLFSYEDSNQRKDYFLDSRILNGSCTTKFYRKSLLEAAAVRFAENMCYEEPLFTIPLRLYVNKVAVTNLPLYYYRSNPSGTTLSTMQKPMAITDHLRVQLMLYARLKGEEAYPLFKEEIDQYFLHAYYAEPFYFLRQRKLPMPSELLQLMKEQVWQLFPDLQLEEIRQAPLLQDDLGLFQTLWED